MDLIPPMLLPLLLGTFLVVPCLAADVHLPHDNAVDVACGPAPGGGVEIVSTTNEHTKVIRSTDAGLSWSPVSGEGLELYEPLQVEYWPHPTTPRYFIGTDDGVWVYDPNAGSVTSQSAGLPVGQRRVVSIAASLNGEGPVVLATTTGELYAWDDLASSWGLLLQTGLADDYSQVAVTPYYDPLASPGPDQMILAGVAGQLHVSEDGGATWAIQADFATAAGSPADWHITGLAFTEDFATSSTIVLGRGREELANPTLSEGEVWRSIDAGQTFTRVRGFGSSVRALTASGPDPGGDRVILLGVEAWPDEKNMAIAEGVYLSTDAGATWSDFSNYRDFSLEPEGEINTGIPPEDAARVALAVSSEFANDGMVFYARSAGLFRSLDEGFSWRQVRMRPSTQARTMAVTKDSNGDVLAFGGLYGSGIVKGNVTTLQAERIVPLTGIFNRDVTVSPNFGLDGSMAVADDRSVALWYDPTKPPANPWGLTGWVAKAQNVFPNAQIVRFHPLYDGSATVPGSNQVLFWGTRFQDGLFRTHDAGASFETVDAFIGGGTVPWFRRIAVSRTYDPASAATRSDVYALSGVHVFRLDDTAWSLVGSLPFAAGEIVVDPSFSRPGNPRLYVSLKHKPNIFEIIDDPAGVTVNLISRPGLEGEIRKIALPPNYPTDPHLFVSTLGTGVMKVDLSNPTAAWEPVGGPFPDVWAESLQLSPDFASDQTVIVGTQDGLWVGQDTPGAPWTPLPFAYDVDNLDPGQTYFSPNQPGNTWPDRPWKWKLLNRFKADQNYGVKLYGPNAAIAFRDGAYVEMEAYASRIDLRTYRGQVIGTVKLTAYDFWTGAELATVTENLNSAALLEPATVSLSLASATAVRIRAEAILAAGQHFAYDGVTLTP